MVPIRNNRDGAVLLWRIGGPPKKPVIGAPAQKPALKLAPRMKTNSTPDRAPTTANDHRVGGRQQEMDMPFPEHGMLTGTPRLNI